MCNSCEQHINLKGFSLLINFLGSLLRSFLSFQISSADLSTFAASDAFPLRVIFIFTLVRTLRETSGGSDITFAQTIATFALPPVV